MREIKFRGKDENNKWWYGGYYTLPDVNGCVIHRIAVNNCTNEKFEFHDVVVNPETVGQFTGLKDKNGKEVYEGDIVCCEWELECLQSSEDSIFPPEDECEIVKFIGEVIWSQDDLQFEIKTSGQLKKPSDNTMPLAYFSEAWKTDRGNDSIVIIGNIHDNIELLTTKTE